MGTTEVEKINEGKESEMLWGHPMREATVRGVGKGVSIGLADNESGTIAQGNKGRH